MFKLMKLVLGCSFLWYDKRFPPQVFAVSVAPVGSAPLCPFLILLYDVSLFEHNVLAFPVFHHAKGLKRADNVVRINGHLLAQILNRDLFARV